MAPLWVSCGAALRKEVRIPPDLVVGTVVVYPVDFRGAGSADRGVLLAERLASRVLTAWDESVAVLGPRELKILRREDDHVFAATDLLTRLRDEALPSHQAVVIRPWVERRVVSSRHERTDTNGKNLGAQIQEEVTWVAHLEVIAPQRAERVLELTAEKQVDPFERRTDESDPEPEQTRLLDTLLDSTLAELAPHRAAATPVQGRLALRFVPEPAEGTEAHALDAEVAQLGRLQLANPGLSEPEAVRLSRLPAGLFVADPAQTALRAGDVIRSVDGAPASMPSLSRARRRGTCSLEVRRGTEDQKLGCP